MTEAAWRDAVVAYIRAEAQPADKFGHQPRLYELCRQIAASSETRSGLGLKPGEPADDDVLFAAAWMHDLGVFLGHRPSDPAALAGWDHVPYTIARTGALLAGWGFPAAKLAQVAESIRTHEAKCDPTLPEAVILRDADILEQLGVIGALRAMVKVGRDTRFASYSDVVPVLERALAILPGKLRLEVSRKLGEDRTLALRAFLKALQYEAGDFLC
jgi:uncharacterized protein